MPIKRLSVTKLLCFAAFFFVWFGVIPTQAEAQEATLSLVPSSGSFGIGQEFSVSVRVHTGGVSINAAEATLNFTPDILSVVSLSKSNSIFSLWTVEPTFSNNGVVAFGGGNSTPFSGSSGALLTINFKAKQEGEAQVTFSNGRILAADGVGTDIFGGSSGGSYTVTSLPTVKPEAPQPSVSAKAGPNIVSTTHPDENGWYSNNNPEFSWDLPNDASAVSFLLDRIPKRDPDSLPERLVSEKSYSDFEDGVWYFHLKFRSASGWGPVAHYRIQIDTKPPRPFEITVIDGMETTNPKPAILFDTTDDLSGIAYYEVEVGSDLKAKIERAGENPFQIAKQIPGTHSIVVKAFDKAGNVAQAISEVVIKAIESPRVISFSGPLFIGERIEVKGTGIPGATVELHVSQNKKRTAVTAAVDEKGDWFLTSERFFISGDYSFFVIQEDAREARSMPSETFAFKVLAFVNIGPWRFSSFSIALTLGILLGINILFVILARRKMRAVRKRALYESEDAKAKLHKSVDYIKEEISAKLKELGHHKRKRDYSHDEIEIEKKLKEEITNLERLMKEEIEDIAEKADRVPTIPRQSPISKLISILKKVF